jgi:hypothetical protein
MNLFFTMVNNIHTERKFDELPLEFEVVRYRSELRLMNRPLEDLRHAFEHLNCAQLVQLIEAADYYWDTESSEIAIDLLAALFRASTPLQLFHYCNIITASHMKFYIEETYYDETFERIGKMSIQDLNAAHPAIFDTHDRTLLEFWVHSCIEKVQRPAMKHIESEIEMFIQRYRHLPYAGVDWRGIDSTFLSEAFKRKYSIFIYTQHTFALKSLQHIIDLTYRNVPRLSLVNLPLNRRMISMLRVLFPMHHWAAEAQLVKEVNGQWTAAGINYATYAQHMQVRFTTSMSLERFIERREAHIELSRLMHLLNELGRDEEGNADEIEDLIPVLWAARERFLQV